MGNAADHMRGRPEYAVSVNLEIKSKQNLAYLSVPAGFELHPVENEGDFRSRKISLNSPNTSFLTKDLVFYFQSKEVEEPSLYLQRSTKHLDEAVVFFSMTPDFAEKSELEEEKDPQSITFKIDGKPKTLKESEDIMVEGGNYVFLVDRSGSMRGDKMELTKDALKLFMRSLPSKS